MRLPSKTICHIESENLKELAMTSNLLSNLVRFSSRISPRRSVSLLALIPVLAALHMHAQTFSSGSDGSDGAYAPTGTSGTVIVFDPTQFHGTQVAANIFNFTTITIPTGVTVRLSGNTLNGPVYWLASGNVDIEGAVDLSGGQGAAATNNPFARVPAVPGSGGYMGGVGGNTSQAALPGGGPGGGAAGTLSNAQAGGGTFSGNQFLIPLIGGSGGGGGLNGNTTFCDGGGAGGGAILIASSTQVTVNGVIYAYGGSGNESAGCDNSGGGSGGAIRLVSNTITGNGSAAVSAAGGSGDRGGATVGGPGVVRFEAFTVAFSGAVAGTFAESSPFPLLLPTAGPPSAQVISINGTSITPNPSIFPDITINTTSAVNVVIQTQNIPTTATITLTILDENGVADTVVQAPPLGSCNASNVCTTTAQVMFPFGASRGLTRVTWTQ
jgi:hypothetical protein